MPVERAFQSNEPREIAEGVWWLAECAIIPLDGNVTHLHVSPYLIVGSEKTLLWDCGTPLYWQTISADLDRLLAGRSLDYIVPSHPEVAHCANIRLLLDRYPEAELTGDIRDYPLFFPEYEDRMVERLVGSELDLGDHTFVFVEAIIKDLVSTQWGYDASREVLFVGDGFAYSHHAPIPGDDRPVHLPGECTALASELGVAPGPEQIIWITKAALYWTHFVKMDLFVDRLEELLRTHPTKLVAPAHGAVIDDVDTILWTIWEALRQSYDPGRGVKRAGAEISEAA
jgi:hypothetical protein